MATGEVAGEEGAGCREAAGVEDREDHQREEDRGRERHPDGDGGVGGGWRAMRGMVCCVSHGCGGVAPEPAGEPGSGSCLSSAPMADGRCVLAETMR